MFGRSRRAIIASWLALGVALDGTGAWARGGEGATEGELAAARSLFADALKDQEAKRFADALDKFQRVRAVRDTAQVEYRIGSCYEGLGQAAPAYVAYRHATVLGQDELKAADVVAASVERVNALAKHLGWLSLALPVRAPQDMEVRLDDAVMPPAALSDPIVLEPGPHVVTATASDATPFRSSIVLPEGAHVSLTISLEPRHPVAPEPVPPSASAGAEVTAARAVAPPRSVEGAGAEAPGAAAADRGRRTTGWITVGAGGILMVGAAVLGVLGGSDFSTVSGKCPDWMCLNATERTNLNSTRNRANLELPLAISLGAVGLVVAATGAYFVLSSKDASSDGRLAPSRPAARVTLGVGVAGLSGEF